MPAGKGSGDGIPTKNADKSGHKFQPETRRRFRRGPDSGHRRRLRQYWTVIPHLVQGKFMIATAQACGTNVRTLRRWMETPEFKQEYSLAKREHFDMVANRL